MFGARLLARADPCAFGVKVAPCRAGPGGVLRWLRVSARWCHRFGDGSVLGVGGCIVMVAACVVFLSGVAGLASAQWGFWWCMFRHVWHVPHPGRLPSCLWLPRLLMLPVVSHLVQSGICRRCDATGHGAGSGCGFGGVSLMGCVGAGVVCGHVRPMVWSTCSRASADVWGGYARGLSGVMQVWSGARIVSRRG